MDDHPRPDAEGDGEQLQGFGDPNGPGGRLYRLTDVRQMADLRVELIRLQLARRGIPITPEIRDRLAKLREEFREKIVGDLNALGVPAGLRNLLSAHAKRDALSLARALRVTQEDLCALFFNAEQMGYVHTLITRDFVPEHLNPTNDESAAFHSDPNSDLGRRWFRKVKATFDERRCLKVHMLDRGPEWHCFYFSFDDSEPAPGQKLHWQGGPHVHFINYLWGDLRRDDILSALERRGASLPSVHLTLQG
jgi:hypothetical protein